MQKGDSLKQLSDAVDILSMVEQLVDGYSRTDQPTEEIPWRGIRLTLGQSKLLILRAYEALLQSQPLPGAGAEAVPAFESRPIKQQKTSFSPLAGSPLAGRIQKAPTGRIRELIEPAPVSGDRAAYAEQDEDFSRKANAVNES